MTNHANFGFTQKVLCLAILSVFGAAHAEEGDEIARYSKPDSSVSIGLGAVSDNSKDRSLFGQYNGLRDHNAYGLLDIDWVKRDDASGTWTILQGRNLGLDNRDLSFSQQKQGDWKYAIDYSELVRHDPRTINTALLGAGSTTPSVVRLAAPGTGGELHLNTRRKGLSLSGEKWITPNLMVEVNFKNEDRDGSRLYGKGFACASATAPGCTAPTATATGWALLMLPEPINSTTRQIEAKLNYADGKLMLSGGYYGSFFTNSHGSLDPTVPAILNNALGKPLPMVPGLHPILNMSMALPPDNQAHQLYLAGNYAFTPTTRATFKYAYSRASQDDSFSGSGLSGAPNGRNDLGAVVTSTLAQVGLTARPMPKLSLLANLRYEDKKDKTPIDAYNIEGTTVFTNSRFSSTKLNGKLEASYQFLPTTRGTLGLDYNSMKRALPVDSTEVAGLSGLRSKTEETGYRAELRHSMSEVFSGSIGYSNSRRTGSNWYSLCATPACMAAGAGYGNLVPASTIIGAAATAIFPASLTDVKREKWRLAADWTPLENLSLQFSAEDGDDRITTAGSKGLRRTGFNLYGVDAVFTLDESWKLSGYATRGEQTVGINHSTGYLADLKNTTDTLGLGVQGKVSAQLQVGADLSFTDDVSRYGQSLDPAASAANKAFFAASAGLPDVTYRLTTLKLFGKYALDKSADLRLDLIHQRARLNDWAWGNNGVPFVYSDNTSLGLNPVQNVTFLGASYVYKWQ